MSRLVLGFLLTLTLAATSRGQGIIAPTAGPINSAMAGASVAAPVDFGASYWNPAILSALPRNEFLLGTQLLIPSIHMTSACPPGRSAASSRPRRVTASRGATAGWPPTWRPASRSG